MDRHRGRVELTLAENISTRPEIVGVALDFIKVQRKKEKGETGGEILERTNVSGKFWVESEAELADGFLLTDICKVTVFKKFRKNWSIWWVLSLVRGWNEHIPLLASKQLTPVQFTHWISGSNKVQRQTGANNDFMSQHTFWERLYVAFYTQFFKVAFKGWWHIVFPYISLCFVCFIPSLKMWDTSCEHNIDLSSHFKLMVVVLLANRRMQVQ